MPARLFLLGLAAATSLAAQYSYLPEIMDGVVPNGSIRTTFAVTIPVGSGS